MSEVDPLEIQAHSAEAVATAAAAQAAAEKARFTQMKAAFSEAVQEMFDVDGGKYIDISRVPLICQAIVQIGKDIGDIKEAQVTQKEFWPVKTLVYGFVTMVMSSFLGGLLYLVLHQ